MLALTADFPDAVPIRHEDRFTTGIPDLSLTVNGYTSWWEFKYADPHCHWTELQAHMCQQLDTQGFLCRFVIFQRGTTHPTAPRPRQIRIVPPQEIQHWRHLGLVVSEGRFDYRDLVRYFRRVHRCEEPSFA
jgi:hypothetical protein